eukprot:11163400-Lingulodinium_polyedra.AAC.1
MLNAMPCHACQAMPFRPTSILITVLSSARLMHYLCVCVLLLFCIFVRFPLVVEFLISLGVSIELFLNPDVVIDARVKH